MPSGKAATTPSHCSEPKEYGGGESDGGKEDRRAAIVAGGNTTPILQATKHDLDPVAALVPALIVFDRFGSGFAPRDAWRDAPFLESSPEPVGVISSVAQKPLRVGKAVEQRGCPSIVADLAGGHEEAERATVCICDGMQLCVHAPFRAADQPPKPPFLTRRLDAVRCALR